VELTGARKCIRLGAGCAYVLNSDRITFIVGTKINEAHQDPSMPVELEIRRNVVTRIAALLEEKYLKEVRIQYF
jgi:hypothetical protein